MRCAASLFLLLLLPLAQAQEPVFRSSTNLQTIAAQVTDKHGNLVTGLTASDFTLLEDGLPQKIAFFGAERQPVSIAVLLDVSRSMEFNGKLDRARALLAPVLQRSRPQDEVFFLPFNDVTGKFQTIDQSKPKLSMATTGAGGSSVYDAIATALCRMRSASNLRQAVIVITDGVDEDSRLKLSQLIDLIAASNPQVFMLGLYDQPEYALFRSHKEITIVGLRQIDNPLHSFSRLAKESGAQAFFPRNDKDLTNALHRIETLLDAQYTLAYYPRHPERLRSIDVRVDRKGLIVSAKARIGEDSHLFRAADCEVSAKDHPFPWESHVTETAAGQRVYHDDFTDDKSGWPNFYFNPIVGEGARYTEHGYQLYRRGAQIGTVASTSPAEIAPLTDATIAAYGPFWRNFDARLTLEEQSFDSDAAGGLVVNVNEDGYFALLLRSKGRNKPPETAFVKIRWGASPITLIHWTAAGSSSSKVHTLAIRSHGSNLDLAVDSTAVGTVVSNNLHPGLAGFCVSGNARLLVHDLKVESLP